MERLKIKQLKDAYYNGAVIQCFLNGEWETVLYPIWDLGIERIRIKQKQNDI